LAFEITSRVVTELGPWLWMLAGFCLIGIEIISARGIALGFGLGAAFTGTMAVMGSSGIVPAIGLKAQFGIWVLLSLGLMSLIKGRMAAAR
jgi:membrane protein implicated in regulation of membrane protease activity